MKKRLSQRYNVNDEEIVQHDPCPDDSSEWWFCPLRSYFASLVADGVVESSEEDPFEAPASESSDGSWRPDGERKRPIKAVSMFVMTVVIEMKM